MPARAPQSDASSTATESIDAQRREPFGKSPAVGARGRATQQRLLAAALELFDELGYHQTSVEGITERAGCSRPTFYQYFESKDDLFRRLAGRYGQALAELIENLEPIDATAEGVEITRRWFDRLLELNDQYRPIANAFAASLRRDEAMVSGARELGDRYAASFSKDLRGPLPSDVPIGSLSNLVMVTAYGASNLGNRPGAAMSRERLAEGLASAVHRAFFGKLPGVNTANVETVTGSEPGESDLDSPAPVAGDLRSKGERTRALLRSSAAGVFAELGYQNTRVDDIVAAASLSHGAFYRYFEDKEAVFSELALGAATDMLALLDQLPDPPDGLEAWCRQYYATYAQHGPLFSMWPEATEAGVRAGSDVQKAVMSTLKAALADRSFGDVAVDSLVLFALVEGGPHATTTYGTLSTDDAVDATVVIMKRSLLD